MNRYYDKVITSFLHELENWANNHPEALKYHEQDFRNKIHSIPTQVLYRMQLLGSEIKPFPEGIKIVTSGEEERLYKKSLDTKQSACVEDEFGNLQLLPPEKPPLSYKVAERSND